MKLNELTEATRISDFIAVIKSKIDGIFNEPDSSVSMLSKLKNLIDMISAGKSLFSTIQKKQMMSEIDDLQLRKQLLAETKKLVKNAVSNPKFRDEKNPKNLDAIKFENEIDKIFDTSVGKISSKIMRIKRKLSLK